MGTFGNSTNEVFNPTVTLPVNAADALAVVDDAHVFTVRISVFMGKVLYFLCMNYRATWPVNPTVL